MPAPPWTEFARAPLVPAAIAATVGLVADRYAGLTVPAGLAVAAVGLLGWLAARGTRSPAAWPTLWLAFAGAAGVYHHTHRHTFPPDDIGSRIGDEPQLIRFRGIVLEDPVTRPGVSSFGRTERDTTVLRATAVVGRDGDWVPASGKLDLTADRPAGDDDVPPLNGVRAGDSVELVGAVSRARSPSNPGERDYADECRDRRVRGAVWVSNSAAAVTRLDRAENVPIALLARARGWASGVLDRSLPGRDAGVARALLLGDTAAMDRDEWDGYIRTGVVHALAISGQHLVVLAGFAWVVLRAAGVRRGRGAWAVMVLIVGYTVLTGMRPSGVRAAVMVTAVCGGLVLRRPVMPANAFALGWLAVVAINPADPFTLGCKLSFLSVFVLVWVASPWLRPVPATPMDDLVDDARPGWIKSVRAVGRVVLGAYALTGLIATANAPLLAADRNMVSPVGILVGPPVVVLTSAALIAGFLLLVTAPVGPVSAVFAWATESALGATGRVVAWADTIPGGSVYTPGPPGWWVGGFYLLVGVVAFLGGTWRRWVVVAIVGWTLLGIAAPAGRPTPDEVRVTFLAVGKGGCTVVETPDGRCLMYDAGTTAGPAAVRRVIAPYLWHRGITRIDEIFLSHADADHFNGLAELLRRFPVGRVTMTPSFAEKSTAEVAEALLAIADTGTPSRLAVAGDRFTAGGITFDVLHPPPVGPPGTENERSLVMVLRHAGNTVLLTGDLENVGTSRVLGLPKVRADVLMAPHHGSRAASPDRLVRWADPRLVVVCRGTRQGNSLTPADVGLGADVWATRDYGAVTLRSSVNGLVAESFVTGETLVVRRGP